MRVSATPPLLAAVVLPGLLVSVEAIAWSLGHPLLPAIEAVTGDWCHHDPARTLSVGQALLPVCSRCTGLYAGLALGPAIGAFLPWQGKVLLRVVGLALIPLAVGLLAAFAEALGLLSTANPTRLFLGLCLTTGPMALGVVGARILGDALIPR